MYANIIRFAWQIYPTRGNRCRSAPNNETRLKNAMQALLSVGQFNHAVVVATDQEAILLDCSAMAAAEARVHLFKGG